MAKRKTRAHKRSRRESKDHVVVTSKSYGNKLKGTKIYFEGRRPPSLAKDGSIKFGKHILEALSGKFPKFRWIITLKTDSIETKYGIVRVRTSLPLLGRMSNEEWDRKRDIKNDIVRRFFSLAYPLHFSATATPTYVPGTLAGLLAPQMLSRLSSKDREALKTFIPAFISSESIGTVSLLKAAAEIKTLRELAADFERELDIDHTESWWQGYVQAKILLMQQGYIKALEKLNIALGDTKYPDFSLVTHDNYLDILEIKKPSTAVLKEDTSRGNFYWDVEMAKAISQTENYIEYVSRHRDALRSHLLDKHQIDVKTLRPRGIILAGDARRFEVKKRDDLRLLSQGIKNVTVVTYDELLTRLKNYIAVLETFARPLTAFKKPRRSKPAKS